MNKKLSIILLVISLLLVSCAGPKPTEIDVELERYRMVAVVECYRSKASVPSTYVDAKDHALVIMAEALAAQNKPDNCAQIAGMNAHEARARIAESQNATLGNVTGTITKGAAAIAGIIVGGEVVKEGMKNSGDKATITGDNNTHINGPDQSRTSTTTTHTTNEGVGR